MRTIKFDEIISPRRTNHYQQNVKPRRHFNWEIACGWFCCAVIMTAGGVLIIQIGRWAWRYWG